MGHGLAVCRASAIATSPLGAVAIPLSHPLAWQVNIIKFTRNQAWTLTADCPRKPSTSEDVAIFHYKPSIINIVGVI